MARPKTVEPADLVKLFGSRAEMAAGLGVTKQAIYKMLRSGRPVPKSHYITIAHRFPRRYGHLLRA